MVWIFERQFDHTSEFLRVETKYDNSTKEYMLVVFQTDGTSQTERFRSGPIFQQRLEELEAQLQAERWTQKGTEFLRDGWKIG